MTSDLTIFLFVGRERAAWPVAAPTAGGFFTDDGRDALERRVRNAR